MQIISSGQAGRSLAQGVERATLRNATTAETPRPPVRLNGYHLVIMQAILQ